MKIATVRWIDSHTNQLLQLTTLVDYARCVVSATSMGTSAGQIRKFDPAYQDGKRGPTARLELDEVLQYDGHHEEDHK
eukprot:3454386-Amphidinium_carterae.1